MTNARTAGGSGDEITFSFGRNWSNYLSVVGDEHIQAAVADIEEWLGRDAVRGKSVIDVGSGSGLHALAFHRLGADPVRSFDHDPASVQATRTLHEREGAPDNWEVSHGSALDRELLDGLGTYDIVYSWGVLHHTGQMWQAIENVARLTRPGGRFWISLYTKGPRYPRHLKLKQLYNRLPRPGKWAMEGAFALDAVRYGLVQRRNPFRGWFTPKKRGMSRYYDIVDWLGGLPYEVASPQEVAEFLEARGFGLDRQRVAEESALYCGCSIYLFTRR
jgi:2-polyprenyl-6-hydroxyphenyl methylase/3-demethylubiquinone-9 3-methyltransferase